MLFLCLTTYLILSGVFIQNVVTYNCNRTNETDINCSLNLKNVKECIVCSSAADSKCIDLNEKLDRTSACRIKDKLQACFTHVQGNGTVTRGCLLDEEKFENDCKNGENCKVCQSDNCNDRSIETKSCYKCSSVDDINCKENLNSSLSELCALSVENLGCYRYEKDDAIKRGCLSELSQTEIDLCNKQEESCKTCTGNDCNAKVSFTKCRQCNSTDTVSCIRSPGSVKTTLCHDYLDECFTHVVDDVIVRGCLAESKGYEKDCEVSDLSLCEKCSDRDNCNNRIIDGEFCLTCNTENDENCRNNLNYTMRTQCKLGMQRMGCYLYDDGGDIIKRGCLNHITANEVNMCRQEDEFCKTCIGNDCNAKVSFQNCHVCSSDKDASCIRSPGSVAKKLCKRYLDKCFVHVKDNVVERGCLLDANSSIRLDCENGDICEKCSDTQNCNSKIVDGEFCITCNTETDPNCRNDLNVSMHTQCKLAVKPLGCYRYDDGGHIIKRGCLSDITSHEIAMCRDEDQFCKTCIGNDCNLKVNVQECRICTSNNTVNCIRSPNSVPSKACKKYTDECFVHAENDVVIRGCLSETNDQIRNSCDDSDVCEKCSDNANCNNKLVDGEFCIHCDSETDSNCKNNLNNTMHRQCKLSVNKLGCYLYNDGGEIIKRGCLTDIDPYERIMCRKEGEFCKTCIGNDCNMKTNCQKCRVCSSNTTVSCIRSPGSVQTKMCKNYLDECFVHVTDDIVVRGCLSDANEQVVTECKYQDICEKCANGENCNSKIVDGEFCMTCDSEMDLNCKENVNISMRTQCKLGVNKLGCYLFDDGGDVVKRGCLNDITTYERNWCRESNEFCKTCNGNDCNKKITFQSCRSCSSNSTSLCIRSPSSIPSKQCPAYTDECFVHVENDLVVRGCLSEINDCENSDTCEKCSNTNDCNNKIVDGEFCITCDTKTDANCLNNVTDTMHTQCKLAVNQMGCYLYKDHQNQLTERGCLSDIDSDKRSLCRNESDECKTCIGNDCNKKLDYQKCRTCSSNETLSCIRSPGSVRSQTCSKYTDECFVHVENHVVVRGCLSDHQQYNCENSDLCNKCSSNDNCNNQIIDGEFCITCDSETDSNCRSNVNVTMRQQCPLSVKRMGCYIYDDGGSIIKRGCLNDISQYEIEWCRDKNEFCKVCIGNDCNNQLNFPTCYSCSSKNSSSNCYQPTDETQVETCRYFSDKCFVHVENNEITRGCLSTIKDNKGCDNEKICETCSDNQNCNKRPIVREQCYSCNSLTDPNCDKAPQADLSIPCSDEISLHEMGCFRHETDEYVERGCLSHLSQSQAANCRQNGNTCKTCIGINCNEKESFQTCRQCNSDTDYNCVYPLTGFNSKTNSSDMIVCKNYIDVCATIAYHNGGRTERGCYSEIIPQNLDPSVAVYKDCLNNNCNNEIFPENRAVCHQCDNDCNYNLDNSTRHLCRQYDANEHCYAYIALTMHRGCSSDRTDDKKECDSLDKKCGFCHANNLDGCNNKPYVTVAKLACVTCEGSYDDPCAWGHHEYDTRLCIGYFIFPETESCYINVNRLEEKVTRGCTKDKATDICEFNNATQYCEKCTETRCNIKNVVTQSCLLCDSRIEGQENCSNEHPNIEDFSGKCDSKLAYGYKERGCYTMQKDESTIRGCAIDLKEEERLQCIDPNYKSCSFCNDRDDCNSGAYLIKAFTCIFMILFTGLLKLL